jgi:chemotaxis protein CheY-P-specific phosphatase CheC
LGAVLDLLLIFLKGSLREPFKKINNRFETLPSIESVEQMIATWTTP